MIRFRILLIGLLLLLPGAAIASNFVQLPVPFTPEIPDGNWKNACEEASVTMVESYYLGNKKLRLPAADAKAVMQQLFDWENKHFGRNSDSNATETAKYINEYSSFNATVVTNPVLEDIKAELAAGRPVISLHFGKDLINPHHAWNPRGSYYHMMVLVGFDDASQEFIVNDTADYLTGLDYRYKYATIMDTLRDFDHATRKTVMPPTVLFTSPKQIWQAEGGKRLWLVQGDTKQYISNPTAFKNHRLSGKLIKVVPADKLTALTTGPSIDN